MKQLLILLFVAISFFGSGCSNYLQGSLVDSATHTSLTPATVTLKNNERIYTVETSKHG